ncbi:MAG TPA: hypothetical protein VFZ34_21060 [Blastocatellia bacterium]|nr:hypothetical protein [Blastocatellia bacterium]
MAGLADKLKQAQAAFGSAEPQPVAGNPCPPPQVVKQVAPSPVAQTPAPVVVVPAPAQKEEKKQEKTWVEIVLVDMDGKPVPDVRYQITLPSGEVKEGRLNSYGQAGFYELDPGNCKITFPDLDAEAWEPA